MTNGDGPAGGRRRREQWLDRWRERWRALRRRFRALLHSALGVGEPERDPASARRGPPVEPTPPKDVFLVAPGTISLLTPGLARRVPPHLRGAAAADDASRPLPFGDFLGPAERDHFSALPPIDRRALDDVDWDALARELTRGA